MSDKNLEGVQLLHSCDCSRSLLTTYSGGNEGLWPRHCGCHLAGGIICLPGRQKQLAKATPPLRPSCVWWLNSNPGELPQNPDECRSERLLMYVWFKEPAKTRILRFKKCPWEHCSDHKSRCKVNGRKGQMDIIEDISRNKLV